LIQNLPNVDEIENRINDYFQVVSTQYIKPVESIRKQLRSTIESELKKNSWQTILSKEEKLK
jgi:hypothetical protein